ncbi:MAG: TatD family hydrolase [Microbacter sp.]
MMIDTHAHLYMPEFENDRLEVIARAKAAHVKQIILPNVDRETFQPMCALKSVDQELFHVAVGLHPTAINDQFLAELEWIKQESAHIPFVAYGEIGIDLYWSQDHLNEQITAFEQQLQWAVDDQLPVIIHQRNAFEETIHCVEKYASKGLSGVFHSFGGTLDEAKRILNFEHFYLGINGIVTFKNSQLSETLKHVPLNRLVLETDAPYLTPVPYRGKRNESSFLPFIIKMLCEIYHTSDKVVEEITTQNATTLFRLNQIEF